MDPIRLCLACGPLALYLAVVGVINLGRRPVAISGTRDCIALAIGASGLMLVGPIELFLPQWMIARVSYLAWGFALVSYSLLITLLVGVMRPRLTIYNIAPAAFERVLEEVVREADPAAVRAGPTIVIPRLGLELRIALSPALRNATVVAAREEYDGMWPRFGRRLAECVASVPASRNPCGWVQLLVAAALAGLVAWPLVTQPDAVAQGLFDLLGLN
jgi:hypothetical protein